MEFQLRDPPLGVRGDAMPFTERLVAQPVHVFPPIRAVGGVVEGSEDGSVWGLHRSCPAGSVPRLNIADTVEPRLECVVPGYAEVGGAKVEAGQCSYLREALRHQPRETSVTEVKNPKCTEIA